MEPLVVTPKLSPRSNNFEASQALEGAGIHPLLSRLWAARGVSHPNETSLAWGALIPPGQLTHVQHAAQVMADAIQARKKLMTEADYDYDAATAKEAGHRALRSKIGQAKCRASRYQSLAHHMSAVPQK